MAFELKDGQGTLFKNDKDGVENRPDYRGELNIGGEIYKIAGWLKDGKNGKWMSLSAQPKDDDAPRRDAKRPQARDDAW